MCNYWLHLLKHEPHAEGCTLALSVSPTELDLADGRLRTKTYKTWADIFQALISVGISPELLLQTKKSLDLEGLETLREIPLSEEQLQTLGFSKS